MKSMTEWIFLITWIAAGLVEMPSPVVRVSNGLLRGRLGPMGYYFRYLGVPYGTVGEAYRFKAPGPEPTWDGVFDAINEHVTCEQSITPESKYTMGQRECLVLNVYAPVYVPQHKPLPVMVFLHGGGFLSRSASPGVFGPEYLVPKGVILVTINYRLGILGFLCLGIKQAPGNAGLKDQVAALKWVQRNIRVFGGNPDDITLFGESAGGASVSYHIISPMSKGLFHKAIIQSAAALCSWAFEHNPVYKASLLAKTMGFHSQDPYELYVFFIDKNDTDLITKNVSKEGNIVLAEMFHVPCAEKEIEGEEYFLSEFPHDILEKGTYKKIPMIIGTNSAEGILFAGMETKASMRNIALEKALPKDLEFPSDVERKKIADEVKKMYIGEDKITENSLDRFSRYYGDPFFVYPSLQHTELITRSNEKPIYYYYFDYDGWRNVLKMMMPSKLRKVTGATHGDELFYLFSSKFLPSFFEDRMINIMSTMWTNFAKYGELRRRKQGGDENAKTISSSVTSVNPCQDLDDNENSSVY